MSYTIEIGAVSFHDLADNGESKFALACVSGAPQYRYQKESVSGYQGKEVYNHGFDGLILAIQVAYVGETCEADMNADLAAWGGQVLTIEADGQTYDNCILIDAQPPERNPSCYKVFFIFEQQKPNS